MNTRVISIFALTVIIFLTGCSRFKYVTVEEVKNNPEVRIAHISFPTVIEGVILHTGEEILFQSRGAVYKSKTRTISGVSDTAPVEFDLDEIEWVRIKETTADGYRSSLLDIRTFENRADLRPWKQVDGVCVQSTEFTYFAGRNGAYDPETNTLKGVTDDDKREIEIDIDRVYKINGRLSGNVFDNQRKGYVLGCGAGVAPLSRFSVGGIESYSESEPALGFQILSGIGLDNRNVLALEYNMTYRNSDYFSDIGRRTHSGWFGQGPLHGSQNLTQSILACSWYHYRKSTGNGLFTVFGAGIFGATPSSLGGNDPGIGLMAGGGYRFSRHFQFALHYIYGQTDDGPHLPFRHHQISLLVTFIRM